MTELLILLAVAIYVVCGVFAYGLSIAYFQRWYEDVRDRNGDYCLALGMLLSGPIGLLISYTGRSGWHTGLQWTATDSESVRLRRERIPEKYR